MSSLLKNWDGETVVMRYDRDTGTFVFIAIHSTTLGPGVGGTRMKSYPTPEAGLQDALKLAAGMTYKFAVPGLPWGGAKAVLAVPENLDAQRRKNLLRRYAQLLKQLGGLFHTAPDLGTTADDMDLLAEAGAPHVFCRTAAAGGPGEPGPFTAAGVLAAMETSAEYLFGSPSLAERRVLVQGIGSVGKALVRKLQHRGAEVMINDVNEERIREYREQLALRSVSYDKVYETPCDIFAPCALGGVLNEKTIPKLRCQAVVGAANNQLATPEDAERLRLRNILYAPDYVINIGGAMVSLEIETKGKSPSEAERFVVQNIQRTLKEIFEFARTKDTTTEAAARAIAESRLQK